MIFSCTIENPFYICPINNKQNNKTMTQNWHTNYMNKVKTLSIESLKFIIQDCKEAMQAMPNNPKNGTYQDEIHYCAMEICKRTNNKK